MQKHKVFCLAVAFVVIILIATEILLRVAWGFANAPLYFESRAYEYMAKPNQDGYRFGNHYHYNSFSQRSEEPDSTKTIVLGLGDSVIFGGVLTDQDSLATSLFSAETGMQMLNISAGSWGPDNCAAYLKEKGYKQYLTAWGELICRYIYPRTIGKMIGGGKLLDPDAKVLNGIGIHKNGKEFNSGFAQLKTMADSANIKLIVCLHPDQEELTVKRYNGQGQEIIKWCETNSVQLIKELDEGITKEMYRDGIHTNAKGQRFEADLMKKYIKL